MSRVWSIKGAERFAAAGAVVPACIVKAVDSVEEAGAMVAILFESRPGCVVRQIDGLLYASNISGIFTDVLTITERIVRRRRISPRLKRHLLQAHDRIAAVPRPTDCNCRVKYPGRPRVVPVRPRGLTRRPRLLFPARILRFVKAKLVPRTKSMVSVVDSLARRVHSFALKIRYSSHLTARLANILRSLRHDVRALLKRKVLFCPPVAA